MACGVMAPVSVRRCGRWVRTASSRNRPLRGDYPRRTAVRKMADPKSLRAEGDHGVDAHRAADGDVAGRERGQRLGDAHNGVDTRVGRRRRRRGSLAGRGRRGGRARRQARDRRRRASPRAQRPATECARGVAPSAMRTPSSGTRWLTEYAMTPYTPASARAAAIAAKTTIRNVWNRGVADAVCSVNSIVDARTGTSGLRPTIVRRAVSLSTSGSRDPCAPPASARTPDPDAVRRACRSPPARRAADPMCARRERRRRWS